MTSWTLDERVAENFALRPGYTKGVVITAEVPLSKIVASPNLHKVLLITTQEVVSEAEVLVRGAIRGLVRWVP